MTTRVLVRATLLAALAWPAAALAHAFLDRAVPAVGGKVHGKPAEVRLRFSQALEPAFSTVQVFDAGGKQVDRKDKGLDPADASVLRVSLPPLDPGVYRVVWRVLSVDTHVTEGDYRFEVAP
ncbi:MAG TPA: copper resistance CopC family protein [Burkholderiales bacterium]|nr:copper resistance CopC family protein [Burkholderiales bacterium]